jgi:hypothetical protein
VASRETVVIADREPHQKGDYDQKGINGRDRLHQRLGHPDLPLPNRMVLPAERRMTLLDSAESDARRWFGLRGRGSRDHLAASRGRISRRLVGALLDVVAIFLDHLDVTVNGAPLRDVTLDEVGLMGRVVAVTRCRRAETSELPPRVEGWRNDIRRPRCRKRSDERPREQSSERSWPPSDMRWCAPLISILSRRRDTARIVGR